MTANEPAHTKIRRTEVDPPEASPCAACPWLTTNHRRPHPEGYYTDANRRRLWNGLRTGEAPGMTCHPTDPENQPVKNDQRTRECAGAAILAQRELRAFEDSEDFAHYRKGRRLAMTREGLFAVALAPMPQPIGRGLAGTELEMNAAVSLGAGLRPEPASEYRT